MFEKERVLGGFLRVLSGLKQLPSKSVYTPNNAPCPFTSHCLLGFVGAVGRGLASSTQEVSGSEATGYA